MLKDLWHVLTSDDVFKCLPYVAVVEVASPLGFARISKAEARRMLGHRYFPYTYEVSYTILADTLTIHKIA